jgi:nitrite reductase
MLPAQGGFVELSFKEPGTYTFVNHIMSLAEAGAHGKIEVTN